MKTVAEINLLVIVVIIFLQIFLSRMKNKWPGLFFPILSFLYSLFTLTQIAGFEAMGKVHIIMSLIITFLVTNIPTIVFLTIYLIIRGKMKKDS